MGASLDDSTRKLVARWREGDQDAAQELFRRYAEPLVALAQRRLSAKLAGRLDAEDVVQSVYRSFFVGARNGRFDIHRGGDLWRLLVAITLHKLRDQVKHHTAAKRSLKREQSLGTSPGLDGLPTDSLTREPSPIEAMILAEEVEQLMRGLEPMQRRMLELRLQGYDVEQIALDTGRSVRTVYRLLDHVREHLESACSGQ